jgi:hypothetical protein
MRRVTDLVRTTGPYSREAAIARPRAQTKEARFCNHVRAELTAQVGGTPTATQKYLIERIVMTLLRIELMDCVALKNSTLTESQARDYLAWNNTVSRMLRSLGTKPASAERTFDHLGELGDLSLAEVDD